jgi:hypothetical protein
MLHLQLKMGEMRTIIMWASLSVGLLLVLAGTMWTYQKWSFGTTQIENPGRASDSSGPKIDRHRELEKQQ